MKLRNFVKKTVLASVVAIAATSVAQAAPVLLYDDYVIHNDVWGAALSGLGLGVTRVDSDVDFNAAINGSYGLVVVQFDNYGHNINLANYVANGGKVIYSDWLSTNDSILGVAAGAHNASNLNITSGSLFNGLSTASQTLVNQGFGTYSRDLIGGNTLATLGAHSGIVSTGNGKVIVNGFLGETFALTADEVRLYQNEVALVNDASAAVPEPSTYATMGLGLALLGALTRKKRA